MGTYFLKMHDSLASVRDLWLDIESDAYAADPNHCYEVVNQWYMSFAEDAQPICFSLWQSNDCLAMYPMLIKTKNGLTLLETLYHHTYSIALPLVRNGFENTVYFGFMQAVLDLSFKWHALKISNVYSFESPAKPLSEEFFMQFNGKCCKLSDQTYAVCLPDSFSEYEQYNFTKKTRKNNRNFMNKIQREGEARFVFLRKEEALEQWPVFVELENKGWKHSQQTSLLQTSNELAYCDMLARHACEQDTLLLAFLEIDGVKVSGIFGFFAGNCFHDLKCGHDPAYAHLSPSNILFVELIRHVLETCPAGTVYNAFPGDYNYKHRFIPAAASCDTYIYFRDNPLSLGSYYVYKAKQDLKRKMGISR